QTPGFMALDSAAGKGLFARALESGLGFTTALGLQRDLSVLAQHVPPLAFLAGDDASLAPKPSQFGVWRLQLAAVATAQRRSVLRRLLRTELASALGDRVREFSDEQPFSGLGIDSLAAVALRNRLSDLIGAPLSATVLFDRPNIAELINHLLGL